MPRQQLQQRGPIDPPQQKILMDFSGGVNFGMPGSKIQENQFTDLQNLQFFKGILRVDTGYKQYRQPVQGTPQAQFQFVQTNGGVQTLLLTTSFLYLDNGIQWQYVGDGVADTTVAVLVPGGSDSFVLGSAANLHVGDPVGISLSDTSQLQTTIIGITGNTVTTADAVPAGLTCNPQAAFVRPLQLNGSLEFQPVGLTWANTNQFILTNGVDPILSFNGVDLVDLPGWSGFTCRALTEFHGFLTLGDVTENGTRFPQRVRWSDQNNPEQPAGLLGGFVDLTDTEDFILSLDTLGPWLIIYREESVMRRSYIGDPLELFFDEYMLQGVGIWNGGCVADTGSTHVIFGPQGVFRYSGGYDVEDVGENVFDYLIGPEGVLNTNAAISIFMLYVAELDEVWIFLPTGQNTAPDTLLRLDQSEEAWWIRKFANFMVGFGFISAIAGRTWQQATESWTQDTSTWLARSKTLEAPQTILCDAINHVTYIYDYVQTSDNGATIEWAFTTKDFESQGNKVRFDGVYAKGIGSQIIVDISFDHGVSWTELGALNFGIAYTEQQLNAQFVADSFRLRFSGSDPTFQLDWLRADFFVESVV